MIELQISQRITKDDPNKLLILKEDEENKNLVNGKNLDIEKKQKIISDKSNYNKVTNLQELRKNQLKKIPISIIILYISYYLFAIYIVNECSSEQFVQDDDCIDGVLVPYLTTWIKSIFLSSFLIYSVFYLTIKRIFHIISGILAFLLVIYLQFIIYGIPQVEKISLRDYKSGQVFTMSLFLSLLFVFNLTCLFYQFLYKRYKKILIVLIIVKLFILLKFTFLIVYSCDGWEDGIIGKLDESDQYCQVKKPNICWPNIVDGWFNLGVETCDLYKDDSEALKEQAITMLKKYKIINQKASQKQIQKLYKQTNYLAWPLTNTIEHSKRTREVDIMNHIINNITQYQSPNQAFKDGKEVVIDVKKLDLIMNVNRNSTLVEHRKKISQGINSLSNNIIVIYIDTVSRQQIFRKLKKTMNFLRKYANNSPNQEDNDKTDKQIFEFFRYHSIDRKTYDNVLKLEYDVNLYKIRNGSVDLSQKELKRSFFSDMKDAGYITSHSANTMSMKCTFRRYFHKKRPLQEFFEKGESDHEFFLFDPQYIQAKNPFGIQQGPNSIYRRCVYKKDANYFPMQYSEKFLDAYKNDKKFLYLEFTDGHEITSEILQYIDDNLYNFLNNIENKGHLQKDTMLYFLSDHGQHLLQAFQVFKAYSGLNNSDVYSIERMLPFYFMLVTKDLLKKVENLESNLLNNSQTIFGIGQVRNTLITNMYGLNNSTNSDIQNNSLFQELKKDNTCLDIGMIPLPQPQQYCSCLPQEGYEEGVQIRNNTQINQNNNN